MTIERFQKDQPIQLVFSEITVGDWVSGIRYARKKSTLATHEIRVPEDAGVLFELHATEAGVEVSLNGEPAWNAVSEDPVAARAMISSHGLIGFIARGETVVFRNTAAMFLSPD